MKDYLFIDCFNSICMGLVASLHQQSLAFKMLKCSVFHCVPTGKRVHKWSTPYPQVSQILIQQFLNGLEMFLTLCVLLSYRLSEFPSKESVLLTVGVHLLPSGAKCPWCSAKSSSEWWARNANLTRTLLHLSFTAVMISCCLFCSPFHWPLRVYRWSQVVSPAFLPSCFLR